MASGLARDSSSSTMDMREVDIEEQECDNRLRRLVGVSLRLAFFEEVDPLTCSTREHTHIRSHYRLTQILTHTKSDFGLLVGVAFGGVCVRKKQYNNENQLIQIINGKGCTSSVME